MQGKQFKGVTAAVATIIVLSLFLPPSVSAWSNGGPSTSVSSPRYSTHDWIAQHALDWLPDAEKSFIVNNLDNYLYGTELPDFPDAIGGDGIGDTTRHHVYYRSGGGLQDDVGAGRAQDMFDLALESLRSGNYPVAAKWAGAMAHYMGDLAVFAHVMGASTDWGEEVHHSEYEDYMKDQTVSYSNSWDAMLAYDGILENVTARDAALRIAHDTTFDVSGQGRTATWMDSNHDWLDSSFRTRVGQSLNIAANSIADALHTLWVDAGKPVESGILFGDLVILLAIVLVIVAILVLVAIASPRKSKKRRRRYR